MKKTEILFCLDTEDFTCSHSADAIRDLANILADEGLRGCFMVVGLLAKQLVTWRRFDVLDALAKHEVDFHSFGHSLHPTINEYTDVADFSLARDRLLKEECDGMGMVSAATGVSSFAAAVPPGNSWSYAAMYTYAELGIPAYCDSPLQSVSGKDYFFCNALHLPYCVSFESLFYEGRKYDRQKLFDSFAQRDRVLLYTHPNRALYEEFWDAVNYNGKNLHAFGEWEEARRSSEETTRGNYEGLRRLLRELKADERFEFSTVGDEVERARRVRRLTVDDLPAVREALLESFAPLSQPVPFSLSEIFCACVSFLRGAREYVPSDVFGFLDRPTGLSAAVTLSASAIKEAARLVETDSFLPHKMRVGETDVGPADYLFAMLGVLCGEEEVSLTPREQLNSLDEFPGLRDLSLKGSWIHSKSFSDSFLSERLRLQAWTIREA